MKSPARLGEIAPEAFLSVAEETGAIVPIGEWMLRQACTTAATWPRGLAGLGWGLPMALGSNEVRLLELAGEAANGVRGHVGLSVDAPVPAVQAFDKKFLDPVRLAALMRTAFSTIVRESQDLACGVFDTRGDVPDLAARESEIVHAAQAITRASRVLMCPTYYSDDRMLDVVFGQRPNGYLEDLGRRLEPTVRVYWTGEEICAREFSPGHLTRVAEALGRKPTLWDNYPVNDGPRMSRFLHLRGFTGRRHTIADRVAGHAINPALQSHLSLIPAATSTATVTTMIGTM